jgi:hypothetical protein
MGPKKGKVIKKKTSNEEQITSITKNTEIRESLEGDALNLDVQYNPEIVNGLLEDLEYQVDSKIIQIKKDADFMSTSIKQSFHLELIKLPSSVKNMSLARFKEEYGDSLEAVTRGAMSSLSNKNALKNSNTSSKNNRNNVHSTGTKNKSNAPSGIFETPSQKQSNNSLFVPETPSSRQPKEGEIILSSNGSPLGEFQTVIKQPRVGGGLAPPPTPGVFVSQLIYILILNNILFLINS